MLSALVGGREARGGLKLPPLSEKSAVKDISSFILPGGGFIANSAMHGLRQGRPCTSGIQLAELKRSLRTSDRKKSYKPDRSYCAPINPPPLIEFKGPEKLERRCETRCSTKEQENLTLVPWLRQAQNIPRPESRRPNSNFNLDGSSDQAERCASRDAGGRRALWKQLQQSMTGTPGESPSDVPSMFKQLYTPPDLG